jgi:hypothetical protein
MGAATFDERAHFQHLSGEAIRSVDVITPSVSDTRQQRRTRAYPRSFVPT